MKERLHIEGRDAAALMNYVDGMSQLRITDDSNHMVDCSPIAVVETRFYHRSGKPLTAAYICEIDLDPRCYYVRDEVVGEKYPDARSLWCALRAAMRGMGWSGQLTGPNSITIDDFMAILWRHAEAKGFSISHIGWL